MLELNKVTYQHQTGQEIILKNINMKIEQKEETKCKRTYMIMVK